MGWVLGCRGFQQEGGRRGAQWRCAGSRRHCLKCVLPDNINSPNWVNNFPHHFSYRSLILSVILPTCDPWWSVGYRLFPVQPHWRTHWDRWRSSDCRSYSDSPRLLWASCAGIWNATCRDRSEQTNDTSNWDRRQRNCFPMACCWR